MLQPHGEHIVSVEPMDPEQLGVTKEERTAIYDLTCKTQSGTTILIEMQNSKQNHFVDRTEYYKSKLIVAQALRGGWNYKLNKVYLINIMNFPCEQMSYDSTKYRSTVLSVDIESGNIWNDKVISIYLDFHTFKKLKTQKKELANRYEEWLYYMSYLEEFKRMTKKTNDPIFDKFFSSAEIARMTKEEIYLYEASQKRMWDEYAIKETAQQEGFEEGHAAGHAAGQAQGIEKGKRGVAKNLLVQGIDPKVIADATGLTLEEINNL